MPRNTPLYQCPQDLDPVAASEQLWQHAAAQTEVKVEVHRSDDIDPLENARDAWNFGEQPFGTVIQTKNRSGNVFQ